MLDFVTHTFRLIEVVDDVRAAVLGERTKSQLAHSGPDPSVILGLNSKLDDMLHELPAHLRADTDYISLGVSDEAAHRFQVQGRVLRSRYENLIFTYTRIRVDSRLTVDVSSESF